MTYVQRKPVNFHYFLRQKRPGLADHQRLYQNVVATVLPVTPTFYFSPIRNGG
ncbi:hypothetical protein FD25_GL000003 [Levilactobacillus acidifarinae DSM 19394]|uniref:Uncharacterized protein n=1 Tax=Levilactobacillus acidifarinae DSM 19394 = JCM 15949 TaxID=1423715 RepID=A0A0R1LR05_9LACO|nr:hypothetical protein FD25_GL000003 [Levilactobacillus acidifarinae DSM 19394]